MARSVTERLKELWAAFKRPKINPEVAKLIPEIYDHEYWMSRIEGGKRKEEWAKNFAKHTRDFGKRFVDGDMNVYHNISNGELEPLAIEGRYVLTNDLLLPIMPRDQIPEDTLILNRGIASWYFKCIKDFNNPDPLSLELIKGVDPYFKIKVKKEERSNLREDLTIAINTSKLEDMLIGSPEVKQYMIDRNYTTISDGKLVTLAYILTGISGREKEIPNVEYSSL